MSASRAYRPGAGGVTQAGVTYERPITSQGDNGWIASIGYTRGLSSGARDNSFELDLSLSFQ